MISTLDNTIEIRQEFKSLFEYSLDFLFIYDFEGRILDVNDIVLKELEYSKEELLKMSIFDFVTDEEMNLAVTALSKIKENGRVTRYSPFRIKKKSEGYIYLEVSSIPFKLKNNKSVVLGIGHDITLLKETEKDLKISEKKYRSLFDESPIGIMLFDLNGNLIDRNLEIVKVFPEYLGITLTGKNFKQILAFFINSEHLMKVFMERLTALRKGESLEPFEFFIDTKDRRRVWISWQSSLVKVNDETLIQVLLQNITERKEAEQKIQVLFNNSTSGIAYHRILYETNGNPIDYIITDVNPQYENILPFKRENVINKKATEVYQVESAPYIDIYSKVATTQKSTSFEARFPPLDKHFKISVISPKKGEFITVFDDISEQKKTEDAVKLERDKLQAMMDGLTSAEIGIDIVDINYNILFQNQFLRDRFGDISSEYCHKKYMGLTQPCEFCPMVNAIKNNTVETNEVIGNDGRGYELISAPLPNPDGTIDKAIEVVLDITDRKKAEQNLKESEEIFRTIAEQSFMGITIVQDDVISYANQAILDLFGYSLDEVKSWNPLEYLKLFPPKDREFILGQERIQQDGYDRSIHNYKVQFFKKNGESGWLDLFSNPIEYKGRLGGMVSVIDITDKMKAEQNLKESEEKFRIITEQSFLGIIIIQDNQVKYANEAIAKMTEYSTGELVGMKFTDIGEKIVPLEDFDLLLKRHRLRQKFGEDSIEPYVTYRVITKSGNLKWVEQSGKIILIQGTDALLVSIMDITEKKEAEQNIKESEEKFRIITEQSFLGILIIQDSHIKYANEAMSKIIEYSVEELEGMSMDYLAENIFHPEDLPSLTERVRLREQSGEASVPPYSTYRVFTKSGELRWIEDYTKFIIYKGKEARLTTVMDITDKMKAAQDLKESQEKFRTITEQSYMGILIIEDWSIKINYSNQKFADIIGYTREEVENWKIEDFFKLVHPEDVEDLINLAKKKYDTEIEFIKNYQFRVFKKTGEIIWLEIDTKTFPYGDGLAELISVIDITERILAEKIVEKSEKKYRHLFENAPYAIGLIDGKGNIIDFNETVSDFFPNYKKHDLLGKDIFEWISTSNKEKIPLFRELLDQINKGEIKDSIEMQINRVIGDKIWINIHFSLLNIEDETLIQLIIQNITDKKEAEKLIIEENKKLLELDEIRKEMITRISHELKTPLTSIYGAIQILSESLRDQMNDNVLKFVDVIHRGSIRFKKLIENLLDISRMDSRKLELNTQQEDLSEIVNDCVNEMIYLANNRDLQINLNLPHELLYELDKLRIEQAITNLISNAIKNTPFNGIISISLLDYKEYIDIKIEDTGVGLTPEEKLKLFKKFGKIERYGMDLDVDIEGIGLGLFISKEIVELHKGRILVESEGRNKGTTFTIRLFKN